MEKKIQKSPINYFSDLFIAAMVVAWIITIIIMIAAAIYSTIGLQDTSIWCEVGTLVAVPLSCGGAIWMLKNGVQHAIMNKQGKECPYDFPAVDDSMEINGFEEPLEVKIEEGDDTFTVNEEE